MRTSLILSAQLNPRKLVERQVLDEGWNRKIFSKLLIIASRVILPQIVDIRLQHSLDVAIKRRQKHFVLAAECTVEAAFAEAHFVKQPIERSAS